MVETLSNVCKSKTIFVNAVGLITSAQIGFQLKDPGKAGLVGRTVLTLAEWELKFDQGSTMLDNLALGLQHIPKTAKVIFPYYLTIATHFLNLIVLQLRENGLSGEDGVTVQQHVVKVLCHEHVGTVMGYHALVVAQIQTTVKVSATN